MKKKLISFAKILLSILALWLVFSKINIEQILNIISSANYFWLLVAFIFFTFSRFAGSYRMSFYFENLGIKLSQIFNLKLYYLGMFYNLFLPGGIGGDGYKVYFLHKHYGAKVKDLINALLQDRISGLFALLILLCSCFGFSSFMNMFSVNFAVLFLVAIASFSVIFYISKFTKKFHSFFAKGFFIAFALQIFQVICALLILFSFGITDNLGNYLTIFLISSIVSVLPISFGGIGARELTFVYLLEFINQGTEIGVALSVLFFIFTAISSLFGGLFMNIKPE